MSKNLIKLSSLFCGIFALLFILFFSTSVFAQFPPTTTPQTQTTYFYTCFCCDTNPTPGNASFRSNGPLGTSEKDPEAYCSSFCKAKKWEPVGYQVGEEDVKIDKDKTAEYCKTVSTESYNCTCTADNKTYTAIDDADCQTKCIGSGYQFEENKVAGSCACSDGNTYSGTDCTAVCSKVGLTPDPTQTGTDQTGTTQTTPGCKCTNGFKDSSITDSAGCTAKCEGKGGVESFTPPQKKDTQIPGTSISNPISVSTPAELIKKIINYVLGIVGAVAVLIIIYSGFVYMTSRGNEKQIESAKNSLTYAIIGLVVIFASIIIVNAVISAIGG